MMYIVNVYRNERAYPFRWCFLHGAENHDYHCAGKREHCEYSTKMAHSTEQRCTVMENGAGVSDRINTISILYQQVNDILHLPLCNVYMVIFCEWPKMW